MKKKEQNAAVLIISCSRVRIGIGTGHHCLGETVKEGKREECHFIRTTCHSEIQYFSTDSGMVSLVRLNDRGFSVTNFFY